MKVVKILSDLSQHAGFLEKAKEYKEFLEKQESNSARFILHAIQQATKELE